MNPEKAKMIRVGIRILGYLVSKDRNYGLLGDIQELHSFKVSKNGKFRAALWFWLQILRSIPHFLRNIFYWSFVMFNNYFKITLRNFRRHKIYTFINLSGLAIGLACCILILSYVHFEISYDTYHSKSDRIYRLIVQGHMKERAINIASSNNPVGPALAQDFPEVENAVRIRYMYRNEIKQGEKQFFEEDAFWADASVFDVFSFRLLKGDPQSALKNALSVVLTEDAAGKYFGDEDPLGKVLSFNGSDHYNVTGVMENIPGNSHFTFDMLCSFETFAAANRQQVERWVGDFNNFTYLLLKEDADPRKVEAKLIPVVDKNMGRILKTIGWEFKYSLQPLHSIHLHSQLEGEISENSDISYIYIFSAIALFILFLACINFMNLSTARASNRAKEVGMRKVHGAVRTKLIKQFLGESLIYSFLSLFLALLLVQLTLPLFRSLSGRDLTINYLGIPWLIPCLIALALITGLAAGSYPAFVMARFQPARVLKGSLGVGSRKNHFRSILVVFQFAVTTILLISTAVIFNQIHYMKNKKLGFDKEHIVMLQIRDDSTRQAIEAVKQELKHVPGVIDVSASSHAPGWGARHNSCQPEGYNTNESFAMGIISIDQDYLPTLGMELISGRNFSQSFPSDPENSVILNETAAKKIGWENPIGKQIRELDARAVYKTVIGIIKDFHTQSVQEAIEPLMITNLTDSPQVFSLRLSPGNIPDKMKSLRAKWEKTVPNASFDFFFLDESFNSRYWAEERLSRLFSHFSLIAIFIACLGLFGMASYNAEMRTKEVGIRKVLGASSSTLVLMLSQDMVKLVILANIIAWPLAYFISHQWLQDFPYRTSINPLLFILSTFFVLAIGFFTTFFQSLKTSLACPVDTLKYE
jgi:putative ABC transport system permease protein